jgi:chitodextrinase
VAGDTCDIYSGNYAAWTQGANGSSGNPITFQAHPGETVNITSGTISLNGRSYITIQGFTDIRTPITADGTTSYCTIQNNHFTTTGAFYNTDGAGVNAHDNVFRNNVVNMNTFRGSSRTAAIRLFGNSNLFENNEIYNGASDAFELGGRNVVVRGNYFHDIDGSVSTEHVDFMQVIGGSNPTLSYSLIENNVAKNMVSQAHFVQVRASGGQIADTIITRYNFSYNLDSDFSGYGDHNDGSNTVPNGVVYNNTANTSSPLPENGLCAGFDSTGGLAWAYNNICYNLESAGWSPTIFSQGGTGNGNLVFTAGYSGGWNSPYSTEATYNTLRNKDPLFANYPANASLQATSPAINAGVPLTTTSGSGSNSASMTVNNSRPFQPGWAGTQADSICVRSLSSCAQISNINYSTNILSLTSPLSWSTGDPVYLYKNSNGTQVLYGSAPDVGAYEYPSGGSSDTTAPSTPTNLTATAVSSSQINLSWSASTDNVAVTGYRIYRGGTQVGTSVSNSYSDSSLAPSTSYTYTVQAYDAANNSSSQSSSASATTQSGSIPPSTKFTAGQRVQATPGSGSNLNVRATASATGTLLGTQPNLSLGTIISGGQSVDGYYWWNVNFDSGVDGYVVENYLTAYTAPIVGDFNGDGLVNSLDLSLMTSAWNTSNSTYDLNNDGVVNSLDYAILSSNWSV